MQPYHSVISFLLLMGMGTAFAPSAQADYSHLTIPQVQYRGGESHPRPEAIRSLLAEMARRTSVEINREPVDLKIADPKLFHHPLIYMAGDAAFEPLSQKELRILRQYLGFGGFLLIDDNSSKANSGFDASVRKMISSLFPQIPLQKLSREHSIFRSFYLINQVVGRLVHNSYLEGISIKGRTALIYSTNDMGGAWSRNKLGHWNYDIVVGGHRQRQLSIRLGVNIIMYALTLDYKKDMVHLPIILERLRRYHSQ